MQNADEFQTAMLEMLEYQRPPAGMVALLINVGAEKPQVMHFDVTQNAVIVIKDGYVKADGLILARPAETFAAKVDARKAVKQALRVDRAFMRHVADAASNNPPTSSRVVAVRRAREITQLSLREALTLVDEIIEEERSS